MDHARIQAEHALDGLLRGGRGVEAHDEMVAFGVAGLVLAPGFGEEEGAPVGDAADDTVRGENEEGGGAGDSAGGGG